MSANPFVLFTDAPPMQEGGYGCHVLAKNLLQALPDQFGLVITRLMHGDLTRSKVRHDVAPPVVFYPDSSSRWLRRCPPWPRAALELALFILWLPFLALRVRRSGCQRVFALFGADPWFLLRVDLIRRAAGLPLDIYLVDDLEASGHLRGNRLLAWLTRRIEPAVLRQASRVFVISVGYQDHLAEKYGQAATWLPLLTEGGGCTHRPFQPGVPDIRPIVFLGSINELYLDGLCELHAQIRRWNQRPDAPFKLRLQIFTRHEPQTLLSRLPTREDLEVHLDADEAALRVNLRAAWAIFLPYSFSPAMRLLVSTSFSHKFTEGVATGRPLLVYGPAYASIPRYFIEHDLPLVAHDPQSLMEALTQLEACDQPDLTERYQALVGRYHSLAALRRLLAIPPGPAEKKRSLGAAEAHKMF